MSIISKLLSSRQRSDQFTGAIRIGGQEYNTKWSHARSLSTVYRNPTGFRVVENTANEFSRPDWCLTEGGKDSERVDEHAFLDMLNEPMPGIPGTTLQGEISRDLDINGGFFWLKMRGEDFFGNAGPLTGLKRVAPQQITTVTDDDDELLGFIYVDRAGHQSPVYPDEICYVHNPDGERFWHRLAPASIAGLPADIDNSAMRFNAELLENDGGLPGYLVVDGLTTKVFREWVEEWRSNETPGKTRFLASNGGGPGQTGRGNAHYVRVGVSNEEMMYDKLREMAREDICLAFGFPPVLLNPDGTTYANMDTARRSWILSVLLPRWTKVRDTLNVQLRDDLPPGYKIGFNLDIIEELTENLDAQVDREIKILNDAKAQTVNEFLKRIGRDPVTWGDEEPQIGMPPALDPNNPENTDPAQIDDKPEEPPKKDRIVVNTKASKRKAYLEGFHSRVDASETSAAEFMKAAFLSQGEAIAARIRSKKGKSYRKAVEDWWDGERWNEEISQVVLKSDTTTARSVGSFVLSEFEPGSEFDMTSEHMRDWLETRSQDIAGLMNDTTKEDVRGVLADLAQEGASVDELADAVKSYFVDNAEMRAMRFARTEMIGAANYAAEQAAYQTGLDLKKGIDFASDADEDCKSLRGEWVELGGNFSNGLSGPPIHPNCRCALVFDEVEEQ